ncbi:MAG: hypothetical protein HY079_11845 [Elusimicrobia bacterium]|nr:hypothetical protein [Elusimicrobiota bacterium]
MKRLRPPLAAALVALLAGPALAAPSLTTDFNGMSQWLAHEMAQGLAFNAGSNFDPPKEVHGYYLQPDVSLGVGKFPFDKRDFPTITTPALNDYGGANLFPNSTMFPNLAVHLRMGLPWRGDAYIRFADATTPPGYKITPTMTAKVQTNSIGFGLRQHIVIDEDWPKLTLGAHYNHVKGYTRLKGKFNVNTNGFTADSDFLGDIDWNLNSYGVDAVLSHSFGPWTPFLGMGYNYATGSVRTKLDLVSSTFLIPDVIGQGSDRPEQSQGREIFGISYDRPTWSAFMNAELKALGQLQYRSWIVQFGAALPFDIGRGPAIFYKRRADSSTANPDAPAAPKKVKPEAAPMFEPDAPSKPEPRSKPRKKPAPVESAPGDMIFLR